MKKTPLNPEQNKTISETIDLFKSINPATVIMFGNKTERRDALHLHKLYGDKLPDIVAFLPTYNERVKEFYQIRSPHKLLLHIQNLFHVKRKYDADNKYQQDQQQKLIEEQKEVELIKEQQAQIPETDRERIRRERNEKMKSIING